MGERALLALCDGGRNRAQLAAAMLERVATGELTVNRDGLVSAIPTPTGRWRRSVYLQYRRTEIPSMMDTFDYPEMGPNCLSRNVSTVSPQSLMLMNNAHVRKLASSFAARVEAIVESRSAEKPGDQVDIIGWRVNQRFRATLTVGERTPE